MATEKAAIPALLLFFLPLISSRESRTMLIQKLTQRNGFGVFKYQPKSNYSRFVENTGMFVDNSLLVKHIFEDNNTLIFFHCPRTFGKTMNVELLKAFFGIEFEPEAELNTTSNCYLFRNGEYAVNKKWKILTRPLLISTAINFMNMYQGVIPMIHVRLSGITFTNRMEFKQMFADSIKNTFTEHLYLLDGFDNMYHDPNSTWKQKYKAQHLRNNFTKFVEKKGSLEDLKWSIVFLSRTLFEFFNKSAMFLVDDYDFPIVSAYYNDKIDRKEQMIVVNFLQEFVQITFQNGAILKAVFMGVFNFAKEIVLEYSSVDHTVHNFISDDIFEFFGMSRYIADKVFDYIRIPYQTRSKVIEWYGGYKLGNQLELFNPHAVVQYKRFRKTKNYLKVTYYPNIFFLHLIKHNLVRTLSTKLIEGGNVTVPKDRLIFTQSDFYQLNNVIKNPTQKKLQEHHLPSVYAYLLTIGYLSLAKQYDLNNSETEIVALRVPNIMTSQQLLSHLNNIPEKYK